MSIALESSGGGGGGGRYKMDPPGLISRIPFMAMYGSGEKDQGDAESSTSSSIGKNSDLSVDSAEGEDSGDNEAQSDFKGPLDTLDSLEDVLPFKKGISKFYSGKSKSFTSLADTCTISNINDLAKSENAYSKKRKNLLASTLHLEKKAVKTPKHNCSSDNSNSNSSSSSSPHGLPPLHPRGANAKGSHNTDVASPMPYRSFSLSDLQSAVANPDSGGK